jgi:hypothetical protein
MGFLCGGRMMGLSLIKTELMALPLHQNIINLPVSGRELIIIYKIWRFNLFLILFNIEQYE